MGMVSVEEFGEANVVFADDAPDARQRELQFVGRGCDGKKNAGLNRARMHRFQRKRESRGGRRGRMRFQIHLQQLQERLAFAHGDGKTQRAGVLRAIFKLQGNCHFVGRHGV